MIATWTLHERRSRRNLPNNRGEGSLLFSPNIVITFDNQNLCIYSQFFNELFFQSPCLFNIIEYWFTHFPKTTTTKIQMIMGQSLINKKCCYSNLKWFYRSLLRFIESKFITIFKTNVDRLMGPDCGVMDSLTAWLILQLDPGWTHRGKMDDEQREFIEI